MSNLDQYISNKRNERIRQEDADRTWIRRLYAPDFCDMFNETSFQVFSHYQELGDVIMAVRDFYADMRRAVGDSPLMMGGDIKGARDTELTYAEMLMDQAIYERRNLGAQFPEIMFHPLYKILEEELMAENETYEEMG